MWIGRIIRIRLCNPSIWNQSGLVLAKGNRIVWQMRMQCWPLCAQSAKEVNRLMNSVLIVDRQAEGRMDGRTDGHECQMHNKYRIHVIVRHLIEIVQPPGKDNWRLTKAPPSARSLGWLSLTLSRVTPHHHHHHQEQQHQQTIVRQISGLLCEQISLAPFCFSGPAELEFEIDFDCPDNY